MHNSIFNLKSLNGSFIKSPLFYNKNLIFFVKSLENVDTDINGLYDYYLSYSYTYIFPI